MKKIKSNITSQKSLSKTHDIIEMLVLKEKVLGVDVYRGHARLCDLANISEADIFDQNSNPTGTQRDLSPKHARDAYTYIKDTELAFWPEVFLCVREKKVISFEASKSIPQIGYLRIDSKLIKNSNIICISRVDGNHRLHFAGGNIDGFPAITRIVSFCLAYKLEMEEEIILFRDINNNQRRMNTSHLDNIETKLTPLEKQKRTDPPLFIAKKLGKDKKSPLFEKIYEGGVKPGYFTIPLRSLKTGIQYMLSQPSKLTELKNPDAQYAVIKNYFFAVEIWQSEAWKEPYKYLVLRGAGLWGICFIGAAVIDKTLANGKFSKTEMLKILKSGAKWDWSKNGDFSGLSGRGGAMKIRDLVVGDFTDESGFSIKSLVDEIIHS
ncbi:DGQHR domain-containing protein [Acidobacteriota bacterium]